MQAIPDDILYEIVIYLPPNDVLSFRRICKRIYNLQKIVQIWEGKARWYGISQNKISIVNIEKYANRLYWPLLCTCNVLSKKLVNRCARKIDWDMIINFADMSSAFKHVFWKINKYANDFLKSHANRRTWRYIAKHHAIPKRLLDDYSDRIPPELAAKHFAEIGRQ